MEGAGCISADCSRRRVRHTGAVSGRGCVGPACSLPHTHLRSVALSLLKVIKGKSVKRSKRARSRAVL